MNLSATDSAYTKPVQAALTSNAGQPLAPRRCCSRQAVDGKIRSGVVVPSTIRSSSDGVDARGLERAQRRMVGQVAVVSPSAATWRSRMPVRVRSTRRSCRRTSRGRRWSAPFPAGSCRCRAMRPRLLASACALAPRAAAAERLRFGRHPRGSIFLDDLGLRDDDLLAAVVTVGRHVVAHDASRPSSGRWTAAWRSARRARGACRGGTGKLGTSVQPWECSSFNTSVQNRLLETATAAALFPATGAIRHSGASSARPAPRTGWLVPSRPPRRPILLHRLRRPAMPAPPARRGSIRPRPGRRAATCRPPASTAVRSLAEARPRPLPGRVGGHQREPLHHLHGLQEAFHGALACQRQCLPGPATRRRALQSVDAVELERETHHACIVAKGIAQPRHGGQWQRSLRTPAGRPPCARRRAPRAIPRT